MTDQPITEETSYFESSPAQRADVEGTAGGYFTMKTPDDAMEALAYFSKRCSNCQFEERCPGEPCAIYRAERQARDILRTTPVAAGVPLREDIA